MAKPIPEPDWSQAVMAREAFIDLVHAEGKAHYRSLPWRHIDDAYAVLVSEIMLQQTQVARVERFWRRFLAALPTLDALAAASTADVLELWQGLGYNRRALALKRTADECAARHGGQLPRSYDELVALPGIGPATAAGVRAFALNEPGVYLETNVRAVLIHCLFPDAEGVKDRQLEPFVADTCPADDPRDWYYALLDFGAHLKATHPNPTRKSAHYTRQSAFEGSRRQKRSWLVRYVLAEPEGVAPASALAALSAAEQKAGRPAVDQELFSSIVDDLVAEGFFRRAEDGRLAA